MNPLFSIEHSRLAYRTDFALYGAASFTLATTLVWAGPPHQWLALAALHHGSRSQGGHDGVTTGVWEQVFATAAALR